MKRVNFHLTALQIEQLKILSKETGLSFAELIRRAVDNFLGKHERCIVTPLERSMSETFSRALKG